MISGYSESAWKRITAIVAPALVIAGCAGTPEAPATGETQPQQAPATTTKEPPVTAKTLTDTSWLAINILGKPASAAQSTLSLGADEVNGNAGCNEFRGNVEIDGKRLRFGALATTRKMCAPPVNGQETVFLEALSLTHSWQRTGDTLQLLDESGALLVDLQPR